MHGLLENEIALIELPVAISDQGDKRPREEKQK